MMEKLLKEATALAQKGDMDGFNAFMSKKIIRELPPRDRQVFGQLQELCFRNAVKKIGPR